LKLLSSFVLLLFIFQRAQTAPDFYIGIFLSGLYPLGKILLLSDHRAKKMKSRPARRLPVSLAGSSLSAKLRQKSGDTGTRSGYHRFFMCSEIQSLGTVSK